MRYSESREYASQFLTAQFPSLVDSAIAEISEQHDVVWHPIGQPDNHGIVYGQPSAPIGCLTSLVANSIDSVFKRAIVDADDDTVPYDADAHEAASELFETPENEVIQLAADGTTPRSNTWPRDVLNLVLTDEGVGCTPDSFEASFLQPFQRGGSDYDAQFLSGQYGMHRLGVLQFAGRPKANTYQFVASASVHEPETWVWTVIREKEQDGTHPQFEYMKVDGYLPRFKGTFQFEHSRLDDSPQSHGTITKVFDYTYDKVSRSKIHSEESLLYAIERYLPDIPLTLRLEDPRYDASMRQLDTQGYLSYARKHTDGLVDETLRHDSIEIPIVASDEDDSNEASVTTAHVNEDVWEKRRGTDRLAMDLIQNELAVLFTVNGQTVASLGSDFLRDACNMSDDVADNLVTIVELDAFAADGILCRVVSPTAFDLQGTPQGRAVRTAVRTWLR